MRLTLTNNFDGSNDWVRIFTQSTSIFASMTSTNFLICQLLPALSAQTDFSIGYYAQCSRATDGSGNYYYHLAGPVGGYSTGDYLLQIS